MSVLVFALLAGRAQAQSRVPSIVPQPRYERAEAGIYVWPSRVRISAGAAERSAAAQLRGYLAENGMTARIVDRTAKADVVLRAATGYDPRLGDEGYALRVRLAGVTLRSNTPRGLFYAVQTLEQISARPGPQTLSRIVTIVDWPAYRWRGIHLDVARHFFPVPVIERYIDIAARYKLNVFHWHLTDDQAWRLHSDRYPALGAGGRQYSLADVRRVVAYAARRYVTVVPEIDMPAHADAVLRVMPNLSCGHGTLCATGAGAAFARNVLADAMADFPSPYVHAGGDEVPPGASAAQPRFTRTVEREIESQNRRLVGWDEIVTPGLSSRAIVMAWRSRSRAAQAARHGNDVVVSSAPLYLDAAQGDAAQEPRASRHMSTLEEVYADPVMPPGLSPTAAAHVLGGQGNVWTEHIATEQHLFYMTLPRELALAEILWTPRERKSWDSFLARLPAQFTWLEDHHYPFRIPNASFALTGGRTVFQSIQGHVQVAAAWTTARVLTVTLSVPLNGTIIRYTTDGSAPSGLSPVYTRPFAIRVGTSPTHLRAAAFLREHRSAVSACIVAHLSSAALRKLRHGSSSWASIVSP